MKNWMEHKPEEQASIKLGDERESYASRAVSHSYFYYVMLIHVGNYLQVIFE